MSGQIEDAVRDLLISEIGWSGSSALLTPSFDLIDNDVLDSLGIFQLVGLIEDRWGFEVDDMDLVPENFGTIAAISRLISSSAPADA